MSGCFSVMHFGVAHKIKLKKWVLVSQALGSVTLPQIVPGALVCADGFHVQGNSLHQIKQVQKLGVSSCPSLTGHG